MECGLLIREKFYSAVRDKAGIKTEKYTNIFTRLNFKKMKEKCEQLFVQKKMGIQFQDYLRIEKIVLVQERRAHEATWSKIQRSYFGPTNNIKNTVANLFLNRIEIVLEPNNKNELFWGILTQGTNVHPIDFHKEKDRKVASTVPKYFEWIDIINFNIQLEVFCVRINKLYQTVAKKKLKNCTQLPTHQCYKIILEEINKSSSCSSCAKANIHYDSLTHSFRKDFETINKSSLSGKLDVHLEVKGLKGDISIGEARAERIHWFFARCELINRFLMCTYYNNTRPNEKIDLGYVFEKIEQIHALYEDTYVMTLSIFKKKGDIITARATLYLKFTKLSVAEIWKTELNRTFESLKK